MIPPYAPNHVILLKLTPSATLVNGKVASCKIHGAWVLALHLVDAGSQIDIVSFNATAAVLDQWSRLYPRVGQT